MRPASRSASGQGTKAGGGGTAGGEARGRLRRSRRPAPARRCERRGARSPGRADAFGSLALDRRGAIWRAIGLDRTGHELDLPPLFAWAEGRTAPAEPDVALRRMTLGQEVAEDYANLRLTLRCHPLALLRPWLGRRVIKAARLAEIDDGRRIEVAGLALVRQRRAPRAASSSSPSRTRAGSPIWWWPAVFERFRRLCSAPSSWRCAAGAKEGW